MTPESLGVSAATLAATVATVAYAIKRIEAFVDRLQAICGVLGERVAKIEGRCDERSNCK